LHSITHQAFGKSLSTPQFHSDLAICFAQFIIDRVNLLVHKASVLVKGLSLQPAGNSEAPAENAMLRNDRTDRVIGILLGLCALLLYWRTMPPTVLDGDSGEYQYMAYVLGVPHSPGYPLYIFLGKLFTFLPIGDVAYRINLYSVVFAALAVPLVYWTARRLIPRRAPAVLATLVLIVTPSMWGSAIEAEVYALHLFLGVLTVFLALRWHQEGRVRDFYGMAFVYGLALTNHPIIWFIAPALALLLWMNRARLNWGVLARGAMLLILPLLMYAYVPVRAGQLIALQDPENWKLYPRADAILKGVVTEYYNHTPEGVFILISGFDNRQKLEIKSPLDQMDRVQLSVMLLWAQFGLAGLVLAVAGAIESLRRDRQVFLFLGAVAACNGIVAFILHGISTVFYFSLTYFILALWIGFGIDLLMQWAQSVRQSVSASWVAALATPWAVALVLCLLPLSAAAVNFPSFDESNNYGPRDDAQTVLHDNLAPNGVVIAPWEVSQPIRYFQFVENQRPDLLVVHVACNWPQFSTMLANAHSLNRPFYSVEFTPEYKTDPGPRTVQAVPLPLVQQPQPRYTVSKPNITPEVQVLGYDLDPDPPQPGKPTRVWIYYRATARMYPMYSAMLTVGDVTGRLWGEYSRFPVSSCFPTYRWYELGEYYRDGWTFNLPPDAPNGLYDLDLSWFVYDLDTHMSDYASEKSVPLGSMRVGDITVSTEGRTLLARVGDAISLMGWETNPASATNTVSAQRGQALDVDLLWRAERSLAQSYTVFVHLIDGSGHFITDADSPPLRGLFPTDRWIVGETIRDRHTLTIPTDLAPGDYAIEIGMYDPATLARLPARDADGASLPDDRVVMGTVRVGGK
jgi:hypothetical protein